MSRFKNIVSTLTFAVALATVAVGTASCSSSSQPAYARLQPSAHLVSTPASNFDVVSDQCKLPTEPETVRQDGMNVLLSWQFPASDVLFTQTLPLDYGFLGFRKTMRDEGAEVMEPVADRPAIDSEVSRRERFNSRLAHDGEVGHIRKIDCLEASLFAYQHARVSQIDQPTEFIASVLRKQRDGQDMLAVVFGAGDLMFPEKAYYGFDVVEQLIAEGWSFWYVLHNHTIQKNGNRLALGNPVLSTSDVQLSRSLAKNLSMEQARVTNGFFTFEVKTSDLHVFLTRE